ncbi:probable acetylxylan esterase [Serendipita indica DSM 11827]|uniref:Carboxylic ester hydrolase n=1 Tax=Serendipita indica (strain DSM 11827) TaxID=1109443 RepID=G4TSR7_SERID|nr:probable acetylxylan esterase [Serendipita indica DSM 11827]
MFSTLFGLLAAAGVALGAQNSLQQVTNFGANPNNVGMYVYKPSKLANPTPLIVAIHYCTGSAQAYFTGTQYANKADQYGFIVIYPDSPRSGKCFDVHSTETLTHNGGGDSQGIASMIKYAISNYGVSSSRVYVTGTSSGAMMTNVMAGSYPDLFQASSSYNGVPFGCFAGSSEWNSACAQGQITKTASAWGDLVRAAYPGYTGPRPKMMIWDGTADTTLNYANYAEMLKQWTNVLGVSQTPTTTSTNNPQSGYTKTTYGDVVIGYSVQGVGHTVPVHEDIELAWFGITGGSTSSTVSSSSSSSQGSTLSTSTTTSRQTSTSTSSATSGGQTLWGQCGGQNWIGPTTCSQGTCKYSNAWYSQCLP